MGLDFTSIPDHTGSAIYLIDNGTEIDKRHFEKLASEISRRTKKQIFHMSSKDKDAHAIVKFYQLRGTHFVLIVRDNDQLHQVWSDGERFDASTLAHEAERAG